MSERIYEDYIKNGCCPAGFNEACKSYVFGQSVVDVLLDKIADLKAKIAEKDKEIKEIKIDLGMYKSVNQFLNEYGFEKAKKVLLSIEKQKTKDENLAAIAELHRLKGFCDRWKRSDGSFDYVIVQHTAGNRLFPTLYGFIDQIINQLEVENGRL
ncbi:MAG: hypothetical protein J6K39_03345 [Clostridia bacterium]|nr:hypothetical protein [Clostridia bacterium]